MFALLSGRFRRLLILMVAVPLAGRLLDGAGRRMESASGPTAVSRALRNGGRAAGRVSRGPLRPTFTEPAPSSNGQSPNGVAGPKSRRPGRRRH